MIPVDLALTNYSYAIYINSGGAFSISNYPGNCYVIITDNNLKKIFADKLCQILKKAGKKVAILTIPAGEASKSWETAGDLGRQMLRKGFDRQVEIIALGGGVVGDLAGFVARIFMRGVPFIQVPTSLLAMVDSSIGGKTGVDVPEGKNLLGAFYQPSKVIIDLDFLKTLPEQEFANGMAEIIKYALIWDKGFFRFLEKNVLALQNRQTDLLKQMVTRSAEIKVEVVKEDEQEKGLRRILNFGHTFGHAVESLSHYKLAHGQAVAIGIVFACLLGEERGFKEMGQVKKLLQAYGLPITLTKKYPSADLLAKMRRDKKSVGGAIYFVLPIRIGQVEVVRVGDLDIDKHVLLHYNTI